MTDVNVHDYVESYEFRGESDYTPNDREKALIEDAIEGYRFMLTARPAAPSREAVADLIDLVADVQGEHRSDHATLQNADEIADAILALFAAQPGEAKAVAVAVATPATDARAADFDLDEIKQRVLGALYDYRDAGPEKGETWKSWHYAAFDLASEKIGRLLDQIPATAFTPPDTAALLEKALGRPFTVLFLDGRNEHGTHVLPSLPTNLPPEYERDIPDQAEAIMAEAERLGFKPGEDQVWTVWRWEEPQYGDEGRTELDGYWEFVEIDVPMSKWLRARSALSDIGKARS